MILNTQQFIGLKLELNGYEKFCQKYRYSPTGNDYKDIIDFLLLQQSGTSTMCESTSILYSNLLNEGVKEINTEFNGYDLNELYKSIKNNQDKALVSLKLKFNELIEFSEDSYEDIKESINSISSKDVNKIWAINVAINSFLND